MIRLYDLSIEQLCVEAAKANAAGQTDNAEQGETAGEWWAAIMAEARRRDAELVALRVPHCVVCGGSGQDYYEGRCSSCGGTGEAH